MHDHRLAVPSPKLSPAERTFVSCSPLWLMVSMLAVPSGDQAKLLITLDLCASSLRRGHANLLCIVPILTDDPRREATFGRPG